MKAMVLKAPRKLQFEDVATPEPVRGEVLIRVTNSGLCGTDLKIFSGAIPVGYPRVMGHEIAGEVAASGDGEFREGTRVLVDPALSCGKCAICEAGLPNICPHGALIGRDVDGGFSEYVVVPRAQVFAVPEDVEPGVAPAVQVATTCLHAQRRVNIFPGQRVVIMGLGVSGQIHLQLAKARGAYVMGITRSAWKRSLAEQLGADVTAASGTEAERVVREASSGIGADLVIETTGTAQAIASAICMARPGAMLLLFGITTGEGGLPFYQLYYKELTLVGARVAKPEDFPATLDLVARGTLNLKSLVTDVVPLSRLTTALAMLESEAGEHMKIIVDNTR